MYVNVLRLKTENDTVESGINAIKTTMSDSFIYVFERYFAVLVSLFKV
jgi:hypothetical protein